VSDLLTGDIPLPAYIDQPKVVQDAADEIDSHIGFVYQTPVVLANTPKNRPATLLLKRINNHLATGRLLMEVAAAGEDDQLHAYAQRLVDEALAALNSIVTGSIVLGDAPPIDATGERQTGPLQYNKDEFSQVDAFYDDILFAPPGIYLGPTV
jgi:hypothetical protein